MRTWLIKKILIIWLIFLVLLLGVTVSEASKTIPSGHEPITITSDSKAASSDVFSQFTGLEFTKGTGNITQPLSPATQDPNTQTNEIGYYEMGQSFGGDSHYSGSLNLDTGNKGSTEQNLETQRQLSYNGSEGGRISFREDVSNTDIANSDIAEVSLCPADSNNNSSPDTNSEKVSFGGEVDSSNVSLSSSSSARTISDTGAPVGVTYGIHAQGAGNSVKGVGNAKSEAHVSTMSQSGDTTKTLNYDDITEVSGIFELSKTFSYSS